MRHLQQMSHRMVAAASRAPARTLPSRWGWPAWKWPAANLWCQRRPTAGQYLVAVQPLTWLLLTAPQTGTPRTALAAFHLQPLALAAHRRRLLLQIRKTPLGVHALASSPSLAGSRGLAAVPAPWSGQHVGPQSTSSPSRLSSGALEAAAAPSAAHRHALPPALSRGWIPRNRCFADHTVGLLPNRRVPGSRGTRARATAPQPLDTSYVSLCSWSNTPQRSCRLLKRLW